MIINDELEALQDLQKKLEHGTVDFQLIPKSIGVEPEDGLTERSTVVGNFLRAFVANYVSGAEQRMALTEGLLDWARHSIDERRAKLLMEGMMSQRYFVLERHEKAEPSEQILAIALPIPPTLHEIHAARFALVQHADHGKWHVTLPKLAEAVFLKRSELAGKDVQWVMEPKS